eukprot:g3412.t1
MNTAFREALAFHSRKTVPQLSHKQTVTRLYKRSLKVCMSWYIDRDLFLDKSEELRARFESHRSLNPDSAACRRVLREAEDELQEWLHPDPYVRCYMPGGTSFMRNSPIPLEVVYDQHEGGIPQEVLDETDFVHVDQIPRSLRPVEDRNNI